MSNLIQNKALGIPMPTGNHSTNNAPAFQHHVAFNPHMGNRAHFLNRTKAMNGPFYNGPVCGIYRPGFSSNLMGPGFNPGMASPGFAGFGHVSSPPTPGLSPQNVNALRKSSDFRDGKQRRIDVEKILNKHIYDFLIKRNCIQSASCFQKEIGQEPKSLEVPGCFLAEWWELFWEIFSSRCTPDQISNPSTLYSHMLEMKNEVERRKASAGRQPFKSPGSSPPTRTDNPLEQDGRKEFDSLNLEEKKIWLSQLQHKKNTNMGRGDLEESGSKRLRQEDAPSASGVVVGSMYTQGPNYMHMYNRAYARQRIPIQFSPQHPYRPIAHEWANQGVSLSPKKSVQDSGMVRNTKDLGEALTKTEKPSDVAIESTSDHGKEDLTKNEESKMNDYFSSEHYLVDSAVNGIEEGLLNDLDELFFGATEDDSICSPGPRSAPEHEARDKKSFCYGEMARNETQFMTELLCEQNYGAGSDIMRLDTFDLARGQ